MSDLDIRIGAWRSGAIAGGGLNPDEVDELEAHLWDAIEVDTKRGASPDVAFQNAVKRLGALDDVGREFRKLRMPQVAKQRLVWMLLGYVLFEAIQLVARLVATVVAGAPLPVSLSSIPIVLALLHVLGVVGMVLLLASLVPLFGGDRGRRVFGAFTVVLRSWPVPLLIGAVFLAFATSSLVIDYVQWWTVFRYAAIDRALALTNDWIDLFELALAPTVAFGVMLALWRRGWLRKAQDRSSTSQTLSRAT